MGDMPPIPAVSFAETVTLPCPHCSHAVVAELWLIVNTDDRPDLLDRIRHGDLHTVTCPVCAQAIELAAPLFVAAKQDGVITPTLFFVPAPAADGSTQLLDMSHTLDDVMAHLNTTWPTWLEAMQTVPRSQLAVLLGADNSEAVQVEDAMPLTVAVQPPPSTLADLLEQLFHQETWDAAQQLVEAHPELLSSDADALINNVIAHWQEQGEPDKVAHLTMWGALLHRCREVGIDRAFAEKLLTAEALAQAEQMGLTPEGFLAQLRAAEQMPPALREVLAELAVQGVKIHSQADLEAALATRPDLQAKLATSTNEENGEAATPVAVRPLLDELDRLTEIADMARRVDICRQALQLVDRSINPHLWAVLQGELGDSLVQNPMGNRAENLEQAIAAYEQVLSVRTHSAMPTEWATAKYKLAYAYIERIRGDKAENLEQAIAAYEQVLSVWTRSAMPTEWTIAMYNLATVYAERIRGDKAENLEQAIVAYEQVLQIWTRRDMPTEWAATMNNLAIAYNKRLCGDKAENLEQAIAAYKQVLQVRTCSAMPTEWAQTMTNLANAYSDRIRGDKAENLEQAIVAYEQALQVMTHDTMPIEWAITMNDLAATYRKRICGDKVENLEQVIVVYKQVLQVWTRGATPIKWAVTMSNLALAYSERLRGHKVENLEQAIAAYEQALQVLTRGATPTEWATTMYNLAIAYAARLRGDKAENVEQAIAAYKQVLQVWTCSVMPTEWTQTMTNLANAYSDRIRGDKAENLEQAIVTYEQVLQVITRRAMPIEWAQTMTNLAATYRRRICGNRAENLEQAIAAYKQALEVLERSTMPTEWAKTMNNLANAYSSRIRGDKVENQEQAIAACEQALQVITRSAMPIEWATTMNNLAFAYVERLRGSKAENLEQAIAAYKQALQVTTQSVMPIEWADTVNNLAAAYRRRLRGDRAANLEQALAAYTQALQVRTRSAMPTAWATTMMNLANIYASRIWGDKAENLEQAIAIYKQALQVLTRSAMPIEWATTMMNLADAYYARIRANRSENLEQAVTVYQHCLLIFQLDVLPDGHRRAQRGLGHVHLAAEHWCDAAAAYQSVLAVTELLYTAAPTPEARQAQLVESSGIPAHLAAALFLSAPQDPMVLAEAVLVVERYRARWLAEGIALTHDRPAHVTDACWQRFSAAREQMQFLLAESRLPDNTPGKRPYTTLSPLLAAARTELEAALAEVRITAPDFLPVPTFAQIQAAAQIDTPLVYLLATPAGGLALVVAGPAANKPGFFEKPGLSDVIPLWLGELTEDKLREMLDGYFGAYNRYVRDGRNITVADAWRATLAATTAWLWDAVMEPVIEHLTAQGLNQAVLIPTGLLGLLPLHAAWTPDPTKPTGRRYALDGITLRYAPSAMALAASQTQAQQTPADGILAVDNPDGSLHFSGQEVAAILSYFPVEKQKALRGQSATRQATLDALPGYPVLHFATHGWAGWREPLASGLLMANQPHLTLRDLLDLRLQGARLAVLSACETGIPGTELPDEVVSLPSGLVQAGVAGVVASLWAVNDLSTAMLMERFYRLWQQDGLTPAAALRQAQCWLRDTTNREKADYFRRDVPALAGTRMPASVAADLYVDRMLRYPDARDYADPVYWAAFYLTGV